MTLRRSFLFVILLIGGLTACSKAEPDPTATPDTGSIQAASTLFAQPTRAARMTPTPTPMNEVELDLNRTTARMERAVLAGDVEAYMADVWDGDPLFGEEHHRWAQDWEANPLGVFQIDLYSIQTLAPDTAAARMTILWSLRDRQDAGSAGGATASVLFYREEDTWRLGGERWQTVDLPGIRLYYFSDEIVDNELQAQAMLDYLPSIYATINAEFDLVPEHTAHIKLYENAVTLQNWTRLSMSGMDHWNEPGEAIKVAVGSSNSAPQESFTAAEYTRFVLYEIAGGTHGNFPWWLEEGISLYGGSLSRTVSYRNRVIKQVAARAVSPESAEERLFEWSDTETPSDLFPDEYLFVVDQAFTLVYYITETYGQVQRNEWIRAVARDQTVEEATQTHLGISFTELDEQWRAWLVTQL